MSEKSRITFASVNQAKLPFNLVLQGNEGTPAGTIKIDKELVTFEGNFDESAQVFIEHLARRWSQQWRDLEKRANEFDRFMDAMDTAKEALSAGTPLDLESLFKGEMASAMFATMFAGEFVRSGARNYLELGYNVPEMGEFTVTIQRKEGKTPEQLATRLAEHNIFAWNGNFYALSISERLGVEPSGGLVRIGLAHYNTLDEVERCLTVIDRA